MTFDGVDDQLARGAALNGAADSGDCLISFYVRKTGSGYAPLIANESYLSAVDIYSDLQVTFYDSAGENSIYYFNGSAQDIGAGSWRHVLMALRVSTGTLQVYVDDIDDGGTVGFSGEPSTAYFSDTNWYIGAYQAADFLSADLAEFYFAPGQYLDISVEANRRKFTSAAGKPVDLGADGSNPTGSAPLIYLSVRPGDTAADFCTNRGTGGNFTQNGELILASTSPSD